MDLYDGSNPGAPSLAHLTGAITTGGLTTWDSSGNSLVLQLTADESIGGDGFEVQYTCLSSAPVATRDISIQADGTPVAATEGGQGQWFTLQAQQGVRYNIVVTLLDLDDSVLELYGTDRTTQLAQNDDFQNTLASALDWTCPATGTYYIKVRGYDGHSSGTFSLAVQAAGATGGGGSASGTDPCAQPVEVTGSGEIDFTDSYADQSHCQWVVSCPPGNEVAITIDNLDVESGYDFLDILAGVDLAGTGTPVAHLTGSTLPNPASFTSSSQSSATLLFTSDESVASRGFHLTYACSVSSGATTGQCTPVTVGARPRQGNIDTGGTSITYCLAATGGTTYQISVDLETLADSTLTLFTPDGATQLAENDDYGAGLSSYLEWTAPADGTYRIAVAGYGTETGTFILSVVTGAAGGNDPCNGGSTMDQSTGNIFFSNAYETGATCDWTITCTNGSP